MGTEFCVIDGQNDTIQLLPPAGDTSQITFLERSGLGHIDLPRLRDRNDAGGMFAVFVEPSPDSRSRDERMTKTEPGFSVMPPPSLRPTYARSVTDDLLDRLRRVVRRSDSRIEIVRSVDEIRTNRGTDMTTVVIHI